MGRTALYRDIEPWLPPRAEIQLDADTLWLVMPDGRMRRHPLDGCEPYAVDAVFVARPQRRFVRMLVLERGADRSAVITPPDQGAVAPYVISLPEALTDAAIVDVRAWETLADWVLGGGRLAACSVGDLARLATIASPSFAVLIGEVAAQRALELAWAVHGPLRGGAEVESALQPLVDAARTSPRAAEALVSALAHAAGARRRRRHTTW